MNVFLIYANTVDAKAIAEYAHLVSAEEGHNIYVPMVYEVPDKRIVDELVANIKAADVVHLFYAPESPHVHFMMGLAYALHKPVQIISCQAGAELLSKFADEWQESTRTMLMTKEELVRHNAEKLRKRILSKGE